MPNESKLNPTGLNLFEHFRTDARNKSRVCSHAMPYEKEEDDSQREYLRPLGQSTIKRAKCQIYLNISEPKPPTPPHKTQTSDGMPLPSLAMTWGMPGMKMGDDRGRFPAPVR